MLRKVMTHLRKLEVYMLQKTSLQVNFKNVASFFLLRFFPVAFITSLRPRN